MGGKLLSAAALLLIFAVAIWEGGLSVRAPSAVPREAEYRAAAATVRKGFVPGDLIVWAPAWIGPLVRKELGDLIPAEMVGRPDSLAYGRIWEVSIRGERAPDTASLKPEFSERQGRVAVARYRQQPVTVLYDLAAHYLQARVTQAPPGEGGPEIPCPFVGPLPPGPAGGANRPKTVRGEAGAFRCAASRVERRVMEIDYRPRDGIVVQVEAGKRTMLEFRDLVPQEAEGAGEGAKLVLWFGLHDYYARKTESGPVDVVVDLNGGQARVPVRVFPERGWQQVAVPIGAAGPGVLRLEVSARDARARNLGFAGQVRR
jgi:hypothetical protein